METSKRETLFLHPAGQRDELHRLLHSEAYLGLTYISAVPNTLFGAGNALFFTILGWSLLFLLLSAGGRFCCGPLYLQSGAALEIAAGAVLLASPDIADYPPTPTTTATATSRNLTAAFCTRRTPPASRCGGPGPPGGILWCSWRSGHRGLNRVALYENIVSIELRRRGYNVYVGKLYQKEVDFAALRGSEKLYSQVNGDISHGTTFKREVGLLLPSKAPCLKKDPGPSQPPASCTKSAAFFIGFADFSCF